ncbi:hypothetical protein [Methylophaga sp. OBS3]|uniref:hypothetical protein n=1 Tax=Methylophaga sp. OBS3 TaxID=2991934 RepID=UPI00225A0876|nr:hypothetical protein [Methylophaga sp. OBS3]MCX4189827.1 hypothetical protein [Methylophaga sp. OBS3]
MESGFALISFIASVASLVLAVVAIWITFQIKNQADKVSEKTTDTLTEIKTDAKTISQVAMPELKAYGDSMRRFILSGGNNTEVRNENSDFVDKLEKIDTRLKSLEGENDISKLKAELKLLSESVIDSEKDESRDIAKSSRRDIGRERVGVRMTFPNQVSIETSSPNETWQDLLDYAMHFYDESETKDQYGKKWILVNSKTNEVIDEKFINDESTTFDDIGLKVGDELSWVSLKGK